MFTGPSLFISALQTVEGDADGKTLGVADGRGVLVGVGVGVGAGLAVVPMVTVALDPV